TERSRGVAVDDLGRGAEESLRIGDDQCWHGGAGGRARRHDRGRPTLNGVVHERIAAVVLTGEGDEEISVGDLPAVARDAGDRGVPADDLAGAQGVTERTERDAHAPPPGCRGVGSGPSVTRTTAAFREMLPDAGCCSRTTP